MPDEDPPDPVDDFLESLGLPRRADWPEPYRGPDRRQQDRRQQNRRRLGFTARRSADADLNLTQRRFLVDYVRQLPTETLWEWFDALVLGNLTASHLTMLVEMAQRREVEQREQRASPRRRRGRPATDRLLPLVHPIHNARIRQEWHRLTRQFKGFSQARRAYHATRDRTRRSEIRDTWLRSELGQRLDTARLFQAFWADRQLPPAAMAARLMHRTAVQRLVEREAQARERAARTLSPLSKEFHLMVAARVFDDRRLRLGTWRSFLDRLQRSSSR